MSAFDTTKDLQFHSVLLHAMLEAMPDGFIAVDRDQTIVAINQSFLDVWGLTGLLADGRGLNDLIGQHNRITLQSAVGIVKYPEALQQRIRALEDFSVVARSEVPLKDGRWLDMSTTGLRGADGEFWGRVWFFRDITERKNVEALMKHLAYRDPLTGCANRRYLAERAEVEIARVRRLGKDLAVAVLDVDFFKSINDRHGHAVGDEVLKELVARCRRGIRGADMLARLGGEEFAVLMPDTEFDGATVATERIRTLLTPPFRIGEIEIAVTVSIGISCFALREDTGLDDCLRRADAALYEAKQAGRNCTRRRECTDQ